MNSLALVNGRVLTDSGFEDGVAVLIEDGRIAAVTAPAEAMHRATETHDLQGAIDLLRAPAASGVRGLIEDGVTEVVESDAFVAVWERALRASHSALLATVSGKTDGVVVVSPTGEVGVALGPIVSEIPTLRSCSKMVNTEGEVSRVASSTNTRSGVCGRLRL